MKNKNTLMHIRNFVRNDILDTRSYLKTVIDFLSLNEIVATRQKDHSTRTHTGCGPGFPFQHSYLNLPVHFLVQMLPQVRVTDLRCISK